MVRGRPNSVSIVLARYCRGANAGFALSHHGRLVEKGWGRGVEGADDGNVIFPSHALDKMTNKSPFGDYTIRTVSEPSLDHRRFMQEDADVSVLVQSTCTLYKVLRSVVDFPADVGFVDHSRFSAILIMYSTYTISQSPSHVPIPPPLPPPSQSNLHTNSLNTKRDELRPPAY